VRIRGHVVDRLLAHMDAVAPAEAVGLLLVDERRWFSGSRSRTELEAIHFLPLENVAAEPSTSFEISHVEHVLWVNLERRIGMRLVLFHSHVDAAAVPSSGDRRYGKPGDVIVIGSVATRELRAFVLEANDDEKLSGRVAARELPLERSS
jgi:proteasome lid subunit RPN8/RPN11